MYTTYKHNAPKIVGTDEPSAASDLQGAGQTEEPTSASTTKEPLSEDDKDVTVDVLPAAGEATIQKQIKTKLNNSGNLKVKSFTPGKRSATLATDKILTEQGQGASAKKSKNTCTFSFK
jgi:hypothetical protein